MSVKSSPIDFIGIGAQKAGTTWLWRMFRQLSEFTLPPIKELHYFNRDRKYIYSNKLSEPRLTKRLTDINWIKHVIKDSTLRIKGADADKLKWLYHWYFSTYNDEWYLSLFKQFKGITGEITPDYAVLDDVDIRKMRDLIPNVKIIYMLRNPVERAWSHYRFAVGKGNLKVPDDGPSKSKVMHDFFNSGAQDLRSDYMRTITNYKRYFPASQILICFYDAVQETPEVLLNDIVHFLGGDSSRIAYECSPKDVTNVSMKMEMPEDIQRLLNDKYSVMIKELTQMVGSYSIKWHDDLNQHQRDYTGLLSPSVIMDE